MASALSFYSSEAASATVFDTSFRGFLHYDGAFSDMFVIALMYVGLLLSNLRFSVCLRAGDHIPTHTSAP